MTSRAWAGMGLESTWEQDRQAPGPATLSRHPCPRLTTLNPNLATRMGSRGAGWRAGQEFRLGCHTLPRINPHLCLLKSRGSQQTT